MSESGRALMRATALVEEAAGRGDDVLRLIDQDFWELETLPPNLPRLTQLKTLKIYRTGIRDLRPLAGLRNLERLEAGTGHITSLAPLADLDRLVVLHVDGCPLSDISPITGLTRLQDLSLSGSRVGDLTSLENLVHLERLSLDHTAIVDLGPLSGLRRLTTLTLSGTRVRDLTPLMALKHLRILKLNATDVSDLSPLSALDNLNWLYLNGSRVEDLRPIRNLRGLNSKASGASAILQFHNTPAAEKDSGLAAALRAGDPLLITEKALEYLHSLPPWPEPLPWQKAEGTAAAAPSDDAPNIPEQVPAPLMVAEVNGQLRAVPFQGGLEPHEQERARAGYGTVKDFIADLAGLRQRLSNQMPGFETALRRFERALGDRFEEMNAIAAGEEAEHLGRLAAAAHEAVDPADVAELEGLATRVIRFSNQFSVWRDYRDESLQAPVDATRVVEALPALEALAQSVAEIPGVEAAIAENLRDQIALVREAPENKTAAYGLLLSARNLSAGALGWLGRATVEVIKLGILGTVLHFASLPLQATLQELTALFPGQFGWLAPFLNLPGP